MGVYTIKLEEMKKLLNKEGNMGSKEVSITRMQKIHELLGDKTLDEETKGELNDELNTLVKFTQNERILGNLNKPSSYIIYDIESATTRQLLSLIGKKVIVSGLQTTEYKGRDKTVDITLINESMMEVSSIKRYYDASDNNTFEIFSDNSGKPSVTLRGKNLNNHIIEVFHNE